MPFSFAAARMAAARECSLALSRLGAAWSKSASDTHFEAIICVSCGLPSVRVPELRPGALDKSGRKPSGRPNPLFRTRRRCGPLLSRQLGEPSRRAQVSTGVAHRGTTCQETRSSASSIRSLIHSSNSAGENPTRADKVAGISVRNALQVVLMLRLRLPEFSRRHNFRYCFTGP